MSILVLSFILEAERLQIHSSDPGTETWLGGIPQLLAHHFSIPHREQQRGALSGGLWEHATQTLRSVRAARQLSAFASACCTVAGSSVLGGVITLMKMMAVQSHSLWERMGALVPVPRTGGSKGLQLVKWICKYPSVDRIKCNFLLYFLNGGTDRNFWEHLGLPHLPSVQESDVTAKYGTCTTADCFDFSLESVGKRHLTSSSARFWKQQPVFT